VQGKVSLYILAIRRENAAMNEFPGFMKHAANRVAASDQATSGVEGYVFDGVDGSQMAFWTCYEDANSGIHVHEFDEYLLVIQGCYTLIINGQRIPLGVGGEYFIERGTPHAGEVLAGTRTIHAFGGHRVNRMSP
jgi:quercetin dioxygenase-like cupin family protein